jgi:hypothetical protein
MYQNYSNTVIGYEPPEESLESLTKIRYASPAFITSLWGVFIGFLIAIDPTKKKYFRVFGICIYLLCISPFIVDYLRGPILSLFIILLLFAFVSVFKRQVHYGFNILILVVFSAIIGFYSMYILVPEGFLRILFTGTVKSYLGEDRIEQTQIMMDEFRQNPILGKGIGAVLSSGYQRSGGDALNFESQYPMLLYRLGSVGFFIIFAPLIWLVVELFRKRSFVSKGLVRIEDKFYMCLLLSILVTCVAGIFNPYLKTGYVTTTIAMYFAFRMVLVNKYK